MIASTLRAFPGTSVDYLSDSSKSTTRSSLSSSIIEISPFQLEYFLPSISPFFCLSLNKNRCFCLFITFYCHIFSTWRTPQQNQRGHYSDRILSIRCGYNVIRRLLIEWTNLYIDLILHKHLCIKLWTYPHSTKNNMVCIKLVQYGLCTLFILSWLITNCSS